MGCRRPAAVRIFLSFIGFSVLLREFLAGSYFMCMKANESDERQPFTMVVGYECYAAGVRALELHQRLLARWSDCLDVRLIVWKFEPLGIPALLQKATEDAINADLIVISLTGNHALPPEASTWLNCWRRKNKKCPALALLLDAEYRATEHAQNISALLREVAAESKLPFFTSAADSLEIDHRSGAASGPPQYETPDVLRAALHADEYGEHWGLND